MCSTSECRRVVDETIKELGGIDIVISNAVWTLSETSCSVRIKLMLSKGWTRFSDFADLDSMSEDEWDKVHIFRSVPQSLLYSYGC